MWQALTHKLLKHEIKKKLLQHIFTKGYGGPLVFLWAVSAGVLLILMSMPFYALLITGVCLAAGSLIFWESLKNPKTRKLMIQKFVGCRFSLDADEFRHSQFLQELERGTSYFTEIVLKIMDIARRHSAGEELPSVLTDTDNMLSLQFESARQIKEFNRILSLVESGRKEISRSRYKAASNEDEKLREENIEAIRRMIEEAGASVFEITQKLETLLLQVAQMETKASDRVRAAKFAEETTETLKSLQAVVNARRETADEFIRRIAPERA